MSQTTSGVGHSRLNITALQRLRANYNEMAVLLDVEEPFTHDDLDAEHIPGSQLGSWRQDGILEEVNVIKKPKTLYREWRLTDAARYELEAIARQATVAPCGHRGIVNLGNEYTCSFDGCDERFDRETAERIVGGGD